MKKFGAATLTALIAFSIIGLWRYSARDATHTGVELLIAVEESTLPSFEPAKLRSEDGPLLFLFASPLKFAHLPAALSLAEDLTLNETSRTLRIVFRPDLISPAGMPLTAKTYAEALARNRKRLGTHGPAEALAGIEGGNEEYPTGILVTDASALTLKWTTMPEPANKLMEFAEKKESFFVPESNWNENGWKNPEIFDSIGPWKIKSTTRDSMTLVPSGLPGYLTKFSRILLKRMNAEQLKALPADRPTIIFASAEPGTMGFAPKAERLWGTSHIEPTNAVGDQALLHLVTDMKGYAPAGAPGASTNPD